MKKHFRSYCKTCRLYKIWKWNKFCVWWSESKKSLPLTIEDCCNWEMTKSLYDVHITDAKYSCHIKRNSYSSSFRQKICTIVTMIITVLKYRITSLKICEYSSFLQFLDHFRLFINNLAKILFWFQNHIFIAKFYIFNAKHSKCFSYKFW